MIKLHTFKKTFLADMITPVAAYLKLRDKYVNTLLLESSDYHGEENSFSYLCCKPIAGFEFNNHEVQESYPGQKVLKYTSGDPVKQLKDFKAKFQYEKKSKKHIETGLFGYIAYDAVQYFEEIELKSGKERENSIPLIQYHLYQYVIAFDHFKNECHVIETFTDRRNQAAFDELINVLNIQTSPQFKFNYSGNIKSNFTDQEFLEIVKTGIHHCQIGDVFQVVFSRKFEAKFEGDEFQVYRALRSINPSPYLFYFDYGSFKIFGSSPEAQIVINKQTATIYPIAGTFKRTGDDHADAELAKKLLLDEKENSEHIMLVDLARNDLSKYCENVIVETYKEIQYYSHVIHLVSKVSGKLKEDFNELDIVAATFPAGTLSGAPKFKAMQLIDEQEKSVRGYYGGAIGFMDFEGSFNHAIMIRTFLSQNNQLSFQAGAGVVAKSIPENEVQEVYNKLEALKKALEAAVENGK